MHAKPPSSSYLACLSGVVQRGALLLVTLVHCIAYLHCVGREEGTEDVAVSRGDMRMHTNSQQYA